MRVSGFFPTFLLCLWAGSETLAQDRQSISYDAAAAETKYSANYRVTVGDVPDHILRVFELRRTFAGRPPTFGA